MPPSTDDAEDGKHVLDSNGDVDVCFKANGPDDAELQVLDPSLEEPHDRYNLVYLIILLFGAAMLLPWNMFITASDYFRNFKLLPPLQSCVSNGSTAVLPDCCVGNLTECRASVEYRENFMSYLSIVSQATNLSFNCINLFCRGGGGGGTGKRRMLVALCIMIVFFILTTILAVIDSSEWQFTFFVLTMMTVVVLSGSFGMFGNNLFGMVAPLPDRYTNAALKGNNLSGIITTTIVIITKLAAPDVRTSAIYYFVCAVLVLLIALDCLFALPHNRFFAFHHRKRKEATAGAQVTLSTFILVFKQVWWLLLSVASVFFVTLCTFPNMFVLIRPVGDMNYLGSFFTDITCFAAFNVFAFVGNEVASWIQWPGPKYVWIPVLLRFLFIPIFFFCNYKPAYRLANPDALPVLIESDHVYTLLVILMSFTSGYYSSLCMMYAPGQVHVDLAPIAGMMGGIFIITGIFGGSFFSLAVAKILESAAGGSAVVSSIS